MVVAGLELVGDRLHGLDARVGIPRAGLRRHEERAREERHGRRARAAEDAPYPGPHHEEQDREGERRTPCQHMHEHGPEARQLRRPVGDSRDAEGHERRPLPAEERRRHETQQRRQGHDDRAREGRLAPPQWNDPDARGVGSLLQVERLRVGHGVELLPVRDAPGRAGDGGHRAHTEHDR